MWIPRLLVIGTIVGFVALLAMWSGWWVLLLPGVIVGYALAATVIATRRGSAAIRAFRSASPGKDLLLVYSENPFWKDYIEREWLPRWRARSVVLNWSDRSGWGSEQHAAAQLFRSVAGRREYNPIAIVLSPAGRVTAIRFWRAFRDAKHGRDGALREAEARLSRVLGEGKSK